ncbi:SH3 domain-containing protein [Streptomyces sp. NPDC048723]|uniref:SH3 domain-containing protein n=1 Tax=Streptomyces sp. NPDC048723 TaxID=3365589 RepID=UPI0037166B99
MKRILSVSMLALASLAAVSLPAAAAPAARTMAVAEWNSCGYHPSTNLKLRPGPNTRQGAIGLLTPNDSVHVLKEQGGLYQVSLDQDSETGLKAGTKGWVTKNLTPHVCMRLSVPN